MTTLLSYWSFSISSAILVVLLLTYIFWRNGIPRKGVLITLLLVLVLCFFSPLQILSSRYLLSAHMVVHVLLLLVLGPMLVISENQNANTSSASFGFLKDHPMFSWTIGVSVMWIWHLPRIFNAAMVSMHQNALSALSFLEPLSLVLAGIAFSSPIIHPNSKFRIDPLSGVVYLFTACIGCSLLGLLITFAPIGTYNHFLSMHDHLGLNKIILQSGITRSIDQQAAGLVMWVPCCLVYVSGAMYLLARWFNKKEEAVLSK